MSSKRRRSRYPLKHRFEALSWAMWTGLLRRLPLRLLPLAARLVARYFFDILRFRRRVTLENLAIAFPERSRAERVRLGRACYEHTVYGTAEFLRLTSRRNLPASLPNVEVQNEDEIRRLNQDTAVVVTLGHLGSWEFLPHYFSACGYRLAIIYKPMHNPILDAQFLALRGNAQSQFISTRLEPRQMWKALKEAAAEKRVLVFLADQDARRRGIFVPFFGKEASTAAGPATVASRLNLPIVPMACIRTAPWHFRITFSPAIHPGADGRTAEAVRDLTAAHTAALEAAIRQAPEQYMWFHRRWKSQPR